MMAPRAFVLYGPFKCSYKAGCFSSFFLTFCN